MSDSEQTVRRCITFAGYTTFAFSVVIAVALHSLWAMLGAIPLTALLVAEDAMRGGGSR